MCWSLPESGMSGGSLVLRLLLLTIAWKAVVTQEVHQWSPSGKIRYNMKDFGGKSQDIKLISKYPTPRVGTTG